MTLPESAYRDLFARQWDGRIEVRVPFGRVDVVLRRMTVKGLMSDGREYERRTHQMAVEVEPLASWPHGVRQALAYAGQTNHRSHALGHGLYRGAVAIYGNIDSKLAHRIFTRTEPLVELFLLDGTTWRHIEHRRDLHQSFVPAPDDAISKIVYAPLRGQVVEFPHAP